MSTIRTFIAADVVPTADLSQLLDDLSAIGPPVRVIRSCQLHVTLKFIGDTDRSLVQEIIAVMEACAADCSLSTVELVGVGAFPDRARPSVVWVGMQPIETLVSIASELDRQLEVLEVASENRPYRPHLTLARVRRPRHGRRGQSRWLPDELLEMLHRRQEQSFGRTRIGPIRLYQSDFQTEVNTGKPGPVYTVLHEVAAKP